MALEPTAQVTLTGLRESLLHIARFPLASGLYMLARVTTAMMRYVMDASSS